MISPEFIRELLFHFKFLDIFTAFSTATLLFAYRCERQPHFWPKAAGIFVFVRVLCLIFAYTYGGSIAIEAFYSAILIILMMAGLSLCYSEKPWNLVFYFCCGFMTWYITDRLFLVAASLCRLNSALNPYFVEGTLPHILLYIVSFVVVYLFIFFVVSRRMRRLSGSEIPMQNALLSLLLVSILTPIFYFESQVIANYNLFLYNLLNVGEIVFYVFMLLLQVLTLDAANHA